MTPRPIYRWKSFWLGVFVVVFPWWAWWDSLAQSHFVRYGWSDDFLGCYHIEGRLLLIYWPEYGGGSGWSAGVREVGEEYGAAYLKTILDSERGHAAHYWNIPDSLVFFSFLGLWGGWLVWHWKREQRKLTR